MNSEEQKPQETPLPHSAATEAQTDATGIVPQNQAKNSYKKLGLFFLLGPTALIVISIVLYALTNLLANPSTSSTELFGSTPPIVIILNVFLYIMGAVSVLTWLPGIIIGIILLNKKS